MRGSGVRRITVLGSTGSVGRKVLDLIREQPDRFRVVALAAGRNADRLAEQAREFRPDVVAVADPERVPALRGRLDGLGVRVLGGREGVRAAAAESEADLVVAAIVGAAGLEPTWAALDAGRSVALANKEALVMAGELMLETARRRSAAILPVDSEHCALHQCLRGGRAGEVRRLILTASGGPFRDASPGDLERVTPEMALRHPIWRMGAKITVDSATLMNKGLEVIEAHWLFGVPEDRIDIVIHPQSVVHSLVEFVDGSLLCQMGTPDMRFPIQYALCHPDRLPIGGDGIRLDALPPLEFRAPDRERFPSPDLARAAIRAGGSAPVALNAANEVAVEGFLGGAIAFTRIPGVVREVLDRHDRRPVGSLEEILEADREARSAARSALGRRP